MSFYDFYNDAIDLRKSGDLPGAEQKLKKAIEMAPENHNCWNLLSMVLMEQGKMADAEAAYSKTIEMFPSFDIVDPNSPNAYKAMEAQLGRIYFNRGKIRIREINQKEAGIKDWEKAADLGNLEAIEGLVEFYP